MTDASSGGRLSTWRPLNGLRRRACASAQRRVFSQVNVLKHQGFWGGGGPEYQGSALPECLHSCTSLG